MRAILALLVSVLAVMASAAPARAAAGPVFWTVAQPAVPAGGAVGAGESAILTSISCTSPGDCVAGGSYRNPAGGRQPMLETETNGTWGAPQHVVLPSDAVTTAKTESATIASISCSTQGNCVAVGSYLGSGNGALVVSEVGGVWQRAKTLSPVSGEIAGGGVLDSVSCTSTGNCVAVGTSTVAHGLHKPTIATETNGVWSAPLLPAMPAGDRETLPTSLSVSCPAAGECVIAGTEYPSTGPQLPLIIVQANGRWQAAETLGPVSGVIADANQLLSLGAIDCSAVNECTAVGNDATAGGATGFALVDANGSFTEVGLPYPAGTAGFLTNSTEVGLDAVACADPGDCAAAGAYPTAGTPTGPAAAPMTAVEAGGTWSSPSALSAPADATPSTAGVATVTALSCPVAQQCQGVGLYETAGGQQLPMVADSVPALAVTSTSVPPAQIDHRYTAQLTSTGGAGAATWTVSSGTLPIGLTLNSATGVISGTPRFLQRTSFVVTASQSGPPAQTATVLLSIRVSTTAPPGPRLSEVRVSPRSVSAAGRRVGHRCRAVTRRNRHDAHCLRTVRLSLRTHVTMDATVRVTATRELRGREVRHGLVLRCQAPTRRNRHHRRCRRTARVGGHATLKLHAGTDTIHFAAALSGHPLRPGTYRLRFLPSVKGRRGRAVAATVTITG